MGFLIKLWHVISTVVVVIPKVWPILKIGLSKLWDLFLNKKLAEKKKEELEQAVKVAKETGDTASLEAQIGVGDAESVSVDEVVPAVLAGSVDPTPSLEEKKKSLDQASISSSTGLITSSQNDESSLLGTVAKVASVGLGLAVLSALLSRKESKAASMGFSSTTSGVILDGSGTIKNYAVYKGGFRMGSRLLP